MHLAYTVQRDLQKRKFKLIDQIEIMLQIVAVGYRADWHLHFSTVLTDIADGVNV